MIMGDNARAASGGDTRHRYQHLMAVALCTLLALSAATTSWGRAYQTEFLDGLIARCSTVNTSTLPEASLQQYRIDADPRRGMISCVVQEEREELDPINVPAHVRARYNPVGFVPEEIDMRPVKVNDLISYIGTYDIRAAETLQFEVLIEVQGVGRLVLAFDDLDTSV
ncbi:MAG: DUF4426 domain-containing protein [Pseudomonadales bacterium]